MQYLDSMDRGDPRRQRQPGVSLPAPEQGAQQEWMSSSYQDPQPWSSASRWQVCDNSRIPYSSVKQGTAVNKSTPTRSRWSLLSVQVGICLHA